MRKRRNQTHTIRNIIFEYIRENIKSYFILLVIFFIGLLFGVLFINNTNETQSNQISGYINNFVNSVKENYKISTKTLFMTSIKNNIFIAVLLWFLGCTVIGVPLMYLVIGYKGYCFGYTIAAVTATLGTGKSIAFISATMLLQNIIYIPTIITITVSGIKLYKLIMEDRRKENIKIQILRHTIFSSLMLILLLFSSIIETYVSGNLSQIVLKYC